MGVTYDMRKMSKQGCNIYVIRVGSTSRGVTFMWCM